MPDMSLLRRAFDAQLAGGLQDPGRAFTRRRLFSRVRMPGKVTSVIGMRRAGKTTFLQQLRAERIARGTPPWQLPLLRLEDERLAELDAVALGKLIDEYPERYLDGTAHPEAWFLDEIQVVPGWERLLRRLLDTGSSDLFISGSSAALLSREIATQLRGRGWNALIHPFSFEEALRHGRAAGPGGDAESLLAWLRTGGFPEAQGLSAASRNRLLRDYVDVAILRDVVDRHGVRNVTGLRWLARHLLTNAVERFHRRIQPPHRRTRAARSERRRESFRPFRRVLGHGKKTAHAHAEGPARGDTAGRRGPVGAGMAAGGPPRVRRAEPGRLAVRGAIRLL